MSQSVSNYKHCLPLPPAKQELRGGRFVQITADGLTDYLANGSEARCVGVSRALTKKDEPVAVLTHKGARIVMELSLTAGQSIAAGDPVKSNASGEAVKAASTDLDAVKLGIYLGPDLSPTAAKKFNASILLR